MGSGNAFRKLRQTIEFAISLYLLWEIVNTFTDDATKDKVVAYYNAQKAKYDQYQVWDHDKHFVYNEALEIIDDNSRG
jgi:hypothetical protein